MKTCKVKPFGDGIIIYVKNPEETTDSGIYKPASVLEKEVDNFKELTVTVVSVSDSCSIQNVLKPGDQIYLDACRPTRLYTDDEGSFAYVRTHNILALLND
jgi:co-chaperonin GroES (HSP10)